MSELTAADFPLTSAIAAVMSVRSESGSTNADLRQHSRDVALWPHWSVVLTDNQTAGRGRLDRTWIAPKGASLAVSVLLRNVSPAIWGWVPLIAGSALHQAIAAQLPQHDVGVKWPNDVLVDGRKISGILAEVADGAIILGAGINTAMRPDQLPVPTATSFATLGMEANSDRLLADFLREFRVLLTRASEAGIGPSGVGAVITASSATLGQTVRVDLPDGTAVEGRALRLDADGRLVVAEGQREHIISAGDVVHARISRSG